MNEVLPIIYTPTVGQAIQEYSHIFRRSDGLFLSYSDRKIMRELMISFKRSKDVDLIVVTDSEGMCVVLSFAQLNSQSDSFCLHSLGIGDQGVGGILISIGKGNIYTLGAGINPSRIMNVVLDVGTDNMQLLNDPLYLGLRRARMRGPEYDAFMNKFCDIVREDYPDAFLHFEDFGTANAGRILAERRPLQSCFNDDMQGTAAVVLSALMSAVKVTKSELKDQRICVFGFGTRALEQLPTVSQAS